MSAQLDFIDFFQLDAAFNPTTRSTREVIKSSNRAQLKRQILTVKEWKRQPEPIGLGGSGIIWLEHDEDGKESRVVKQILKAMPTKPLQTDYKRELQALGRLSKRQDLFVHFYGWFESDTSIFLAMEYFELGDLEKFITPKLTEKDAKMIGRQLMEDLQVMHGYHLAHRDLKPANIFVARCAPDWWIKLGDFGIVKRIFTEHNSKPSRNGTLDYMAPEILLENDDEEQNSSHILAVDVWSLGCVLFRLLTQQFPFPQPRHLRLYWRSRQPFPRDILIRHNVSEDGVSLVSEMMKPNPADLMTVTMAILHSWFSIQESTSSPGYHDSFEGNAEDVLGDKSANEGSATEICNSIPGIVPKNNLEDDQNMDIGKRALGDEHPDTLRSIKNLASDGQLQAALDNFEAVLTSEQRQRLQQIIAVPDTSSIIALTIELDIENAQRKRRCVANRLLTLLQPTQQFLTVVNTFASYSAIPALVWGSVKLAIFIGGGWEETVVNTWTPPSCILASYWRHSPPSCILSTNWDQPQLHRDFGRAAGWD